MNQLSNIQHPLPLETKVQANRPKCPCKGGGTEVIQGSIKKIIKTHTGNWYYLSTGTTVQDQWITAIL